MADTLPPPDLTSRAGRWAYRRELRGVAVGWRIAGLSLLASALAVLVSRPALMVAWLPLGLAAMAVLGVAIAKRTRYHRRRIAPR